jgi:hypothetical protein
MTKLLCVIESEQPIFQGLTIQVANQPVYGKYPYLLA